VSKSARYSTEPLSYLNVSRLYRCITKKEQYGVTKLHDYGMLDKRGIGTVLCILTANYVYISKFAYNVHT
jgi:hypothetical protein